MYIFVRTLSRFTRMFRSNINNAGTFLLLMKPEGEVVVSVCVATDETNYIAPQPSNEPPDRGGGLSQLRPANQRGFQRTGRKSTAGHSVL